MTAAADLIRATVPNRVDNQVRGASLAIYRSRRSDRSRSHEAATRYLDTRHHCRESWVAPRDQEEAKMDAMTVAVDLAKDVFEVAVANRAGRIVECKRLTRPQFVRPGLMRVRPGRRW